MKFPNLSTLSLVSALAVEPASAYQESRFVDDNNGPKVTVTIDHKTMTNLEKLGWNVTKTNGQIRICSKGGDDCSTFNLREKDSRTGGDYTFKTIAGGDGNETIVMCAEKHLIIGESERSAYQFIVNENGKYILSTTPIPEDSPLYGKCFPVTT